MKYLITELRFCDFVFIFVVKLGHCRVVMIFLKIRSWLICDEIPNNPYVIINDISLLICDEIHNNPYVIINDISLLICDEILNNPYVIINDISLLICDQIPNNLPENKLYKIFPVLKECISCPRKNRK